ncbi:nitronate monooxygenase family protein [Flavobacterium sp. ENC]|uniref:NAD(P)H-dependent flavin oxidoreductase n=1 Tax=Flavobacterium sp. ENC TaxID=2897330 RepID=UPI001E44DD79|nr:nitronate monooxygenase [Flavobacterium sp. ENC]MCD0467175.1 nitronate monooxygenase [Flavobacterium sp. ENC]
MWNSTKITQLLGIQYPILQGPMGAGFSTAALLAAVSNAGGLGSYGAYTLTPEEILEAGKVIKERTTKPYNINLWVNDVDQALVNYPPEKLEKIKLLFKPYFDEFGIPLPDLSAAIPSKFEKQVETLFEIKPAVFSFIFGIPSKEILNESRRLGIKTVGAATTLEEALALEEAQVDAIVASGFEAGGHRPSFLRPAQDSFTGLFTLLQQLKAKTKTPIIAAGGIINAKGIAAAMTLGADAVQLGTAFMVTEESGATPLHKQVLLSGTANPTTVSKSLTGRMGRMLSNRISDAVPFETEVLPFPLQTRLIAPLKAAALAQGKTEMISFWSGQNTSGLKHYSAEELMQVLITETGALL